MRDDPPETSTPIHGCQQISLHLSPVLPPFHEPLDLVLTQQSSVKFHLIDYLKVFQEKGAAVSS